MPGVSLTGSLLNEWGQEEGLLDRQRENAGVNLKEHLESYHGAATVACEPSVTIDASLNLGFCSIRNTSL